MPSKRIRLRDYIADVNDYPIKGVVFRDVTPLLADPKAYRAAIDMLAEPFKDMKIDTVVSPEARGFLFGCGVAYKLDAGFVPVRKPQKLPRKSATVSYSSEYGGGSLSMHVDAIKPGQRALIVDDLLATGGTIKAAQQLVESLGGIVVGYAFLVRLKNFNGLAQLSANLPTVVLLEL